LDNFNPYPVEQNGSDCRQAIHKVAYRLQAIAAILLDWIRLRRILGIRWYDKVPNAVVNERTKLIADRRHSLFGHICRLPENTPASQALQLSIEAHTGTPPAADWQQVEEDVCLSVGAAWIAGQDRSMWRTLRPSAGQAQQ